MRMSMRSGAEEKCRESGWNGQAPSNHVSGCGFRFAYTVLPILTASIRSVALYPFCRREAEALRT